MDVKSIAIPQSLALVLDSAGAKSGVDFEYLLQTAVRESSLNPSAKAQTSSAVGLFQFLEHTWLDVMKSEGPRLGYQRYADAITEGADGDFSISNKQLRAEVLALREEPQVAADLAAAFTRRNGEYLQERFGRMPSSGELYIAHFLGARGAERMFQAGLNNPDQIAAEVFPKQANANKAIFYADGEARTIRQVYKALVAKHGDSGGQSQFAVQQLAQGAETSAIPSRFETNVSFSQMFVNGAAPQRPIAPQATGKSGFFTQLYSK